MKYLWAYSIPVVAVTGFYFGGWGMYAVVFYAFVLLPFAEILLPLQTENISVDKAEKLSKNTLYDWMLYLNVPIVYGILFYGLQTVSNHSLSNLEFTGLVISTGIVLGANAINVAHELGHRDAFGERFLAKVLLWPSLYSHFYVEHNHGHHLDVGTPKDPSTARFNQPLYFFWIQSVFGTYFKAWKIQRKLNKSNTQNFLSTTNDMLMFTVFQLMYLLLVYLVFGATALLFAIAAAIVGMLLLETINYIEHYGLRRKQLPSGRYERVAEIHSWNSNHTLGRIVLYELTRHSDHHYKSNKKYQLLHCHKSSPQLPFGYPTSMVLAFVPPLWFAIMNRRIPAEMRPNS
ncbi:MAG: alkane 1-monooxygenase [Flavobacteriaceae bacterium]|nr:alkane 1-monooxygenase [Flavobacteriaceae bacterium]